jgi:hypothetical protein
LCSARSKSVHAASSPRLPFSGADLAKASCLAADRL